MKWSINKYEKLTSISCFTSFFNVRISLSCIQMLLIQWWKLSLDVLSYTFYESPAVFLAALSTWPTYITYRVCCTLYLGHLPNDFCVTSPTKLLHFPNNLLRFPNKIASFPQQLESLPQQLVSLPQHIFSFPQQLCVTLPPRQKILIFFKILLGFHISTSLHHFDKSWTVLGI